LPEELAMKLFTIGFTKKSAKVFFTSLANAGVKRLVDVRLNNVSQLAAFTKKEDLRYFTKAICNIEYLHVPDFAPTKEMLDAYKKDEGLWSTYERQFLDLIASRRIEDKLPQSKLDRACLLCSEEIPEQCHRRLVAEYLQQKWPNVEVHHLP
jgi:uncharacterized protein (DUF488 family)